LSAPGTMRATMNDDVAADCSITRRLVDLGDDVS
jgi:hypothetical protein